MPTPDVLEAYTTWHAAKRALRAEWERLATHNAQCHICLRPLVDSELRPALGVCQLCRLKRSAATGWPAGNAGIAHLGPVPARDDLRS
jgi:hypothetical protein